MSGCMIPSELTAFRMCGRGGLDQLFISQEDTLTLFIEIFHDRFKNFEFLESGLLNLEFRSMGFDFFKGIFDNL